MHTHKFREAGVPNFQYSIKLQLFGEERSVRGDGEEGRGGKGRDPPLPNTCGHCLRPSITGNF